MAKLRDEVKFDDLGALVAQMNRDAEQARAVLARRALKGGAAPPSGTSAGGAGATHMTPTGVVRRP